MRSPNASIDVTWSVGPLSRRHGIFLPGTSLLLATTKYSRSADVPGDAPARIHGLDGDGSIQVNDSTASPRSGAERPQQRRRLRRVLAEDMEIGRAVLEPVRAGRARRRGRAPPVEERGVVAPVERGVLRAIDRLRQHLAAVDRQDLDHAVLRPRRRDAVGQMPPIGRRRRVVDGVMDAIVIARPRIHHQTIRAAPAIADPDLRRILVGGALVEEHAERVTRARHSDQIDPGHPAVGVVDRVAELVPPGNRRQRRARKAILIIQIRLHLRATRLHPSVRIAHLAPVERLHHVLDARHRRRCDRRPTHRLVARPHLVASDPRPADLARR
jgi:hypothetical protein